VEEDIKSFLDIELFVVLSTKSTLTGVYVGSRFQELFHGVVVAGFEVSLST
jgi:hypothetical protein